METASCARASLDKPPFAPVLPDTGFLREPQVLAFVPISKSTLWRRVRARTFPVPVKLSTRVTAWKAEDIRQSSALSIEMLRLVIDGDTYEAVAARFGVSRTAVERRIKVIAVQLSESVGVPGLNAGGATFVQRLRQHREGILAALDGFQPRPPFGPRPTRVLSTDEIRQAAQRIKARSARPSHDLALFYILFAAGVRPLEVARLEVRDYLNPDGQVRTTSEVRADVAINGRARPLFFSCAPLQQALDAWIQERRSMHREFGVCDQYRCLDPRSRLFLTPAGEGYAIKAYGEPGQQRHLCRPILEAYRKLFRHSQLRDITPLSVRYTVAAQLYARGADEEQVGLLLGIGDRNAVKEHFPRPRAPLASLVDDLF